MGLALIVSTLWAVDGLLFWVAGDRDLALIVGILTLLPFVLTIYQRHLAGAEAARVYLAQQRARGIGAREARDRIHELAPDGVTFDTDNVPSWPSNLVLLLAIAAMVVLAIATMEVI